MNDRLKRIRKTLGITQKDFASHLGITQTAYSMIEGGKRVLAPRYIKIICNAFGVNESWLAGGKGEMFLESPDERELSMIFERLSPEGRQYLLIMARELLKLQERRQNT